MHNAPKIVIVIPVFNEGKVIADVIMHIVNSGYKNIVVVDDGSTDNTYEILQTLPVTATKHRLNRGKGASVTTAFQIALMHHADIIVTMDGDGQHDPADIATFINEFQQKDVDVVLGARILDKKDMPATRVVANWIADSITYLLYGIHIHDSQSGFRAYTAHALSKIQTRADAYSYESEVLREIKKHRLSYSEVPIHVRYTTYSTSKKHKQNIVNGFKTLYAMIWNILT